MKEDLNKKKINPDVQEYYYCILKNDKFMEKY